MNDGKLTIDLSGVGNDIPTKLGKSRPTLTSITDLGTEGMARMPSAPGKVSFKRSRSVMLPSMNVTRG